MGNKVITSILLLIAVTTYGRAQSQDTTATNNPNQFDISSMYKNIIQGVIESKLQYYETSDALARTAKLTKRYYDALVDEGFTEEQALKIVLEVPLITNTEISGKQ